MSETAFSLSQFTTLVDGLDHPEGVAWGTDGNWYAGGEAGQIYRITSDGTIHASGFNRRICPGSSPGRAAQCLCLRSLPEYGIQGKRRG